MVGLKRWQWAVLGLPVALTAALVLFAAGWQLQRWDLSWIWAALAPLFLGWRWLLVRWTRPQGSSIASAAAEVSAGLAREEAEAAVAEDDRLQQAEAALQATLAAAREDPPIWEDWGAFWQRCQALVVAIAGIYRPAVEYPLLDIYVPQAYGLIRGTVDDLDRWMQKLAPALNRVTVGQAYQAYRLYRQWEPSARRAWQAWRWARWLINPLAAAAQRASQRFGQQANQQLVANLSQLLREAALRNLCRQAIALYSGETLPPAGSTTATPQLARPEGRTLQQLLEQAPSSESVEPPPVTLLLLGRSGAGKSSLVSALLQTERASADGSAGAEATRHYTWQRPMGEALVVTQMPGYATVPSTSLREHAAVRARGSDVLLLAAPAPDPQLQADADLLRAARAQNTAAAAIAAVTQLDRLPALHAWDPPYD